MQRSFRDPWVILVLCAAVASWLPFGNAALAAELGLTVYRASKLDWQVRLASTDSAASFAGMFTFTKALVSHQPVSLEAADRVWQPASNKLGIQLNVWPRWDDGVDFTTAEFSGVCLRSTTAQQQVVYLSSPGQKAARSTPKMR